MHIHTVDLQIAEQETGYGIREFGILSIHTDEGISGYNFASRPGPALWEQLIEVTRGSLIGEDPLQISKIWHKVGGIRGADPAIQGIIDVALWDILGKVAGLPIHQLLGSHRKELQVYASSWVHQSIEPYVDEALAYKKQGFRGYKMHPLTQHRFFSGSDVPVSKDMELCSEVRSAVGEEYSLFLDSAWAYSYPEALKVGQHLQELDFDWFEDPLGAEDIDGYLKLKQQLHIPVMATEITSRGLTGVVPWAKGRATDYLRGDVVLKGGITGMMKIAHLAEAFHINCELHDAYDALNNVATLHVAMALKNCDWYEVLVPHKGNHDLEHLNYGITNPMIIDQGFIQAPTQPGLGSEPDWDLLEQTTTKHY